MRNNTLFVFSGALAALALAGCNNSQPPPAETTTTVNTAPPAVVTTNAAPTTPGSPDTKINNNAGPGSSNGTDQATADAINTAIVHNKEMTGSRVDAVVTGGVARLTGTVQNTQQKALASAAASKTPGVTSVVNKLMIDATGGIHSAPSTPKVVNHTTIINHYIPVPSSPSGGSMAGNGSGSMSNGNTSNGSDSGSGMSGNGNMATPPASANGGNAGNGANGGTGGGQ
jgi:hypothetical protein